MCFKCFVPCLRFQGVGQCPEKAKGNCGFRTKSHQSDIRRSSGAWAVADHAIRLHGRVGFETRACNWAPPDSYMPNSFQLGLRVGKARVECCLGFGSLESPRKGENRLHPTTHSDWLFVLGNVVLDPYLRKGHSEQIHLSDLSATIHASTCVMIVHHQLFQLQYSQHHSAFHTIIIWRRDMWRCPNLKSTTCENKVWTFPNCCLLQTQRQINFKF